MATMPSSILHSSLNWMHAAAPSHSREVPHRQQASLAIIMHTAPKMENTTLITEIVLGVIPVPQVQRATFCAQTLSRVLSWRRAPVPGSFCSMETPHSIVSSQPPIRLSTLQIPPCLEWVPDDGCGAAGFAPALPSLVSSFCFDTPCGFNVETSSLSATGGITTGAMIAASATLPTPFTTSFSFCFPVASLTWYFATET